MNNAVLIQHCWPAEVNADYAAMLEMQVERNQMYCDGRGFDYRAVNGNVKPEYSDPVSGEWPKVELIRAAIEDGYQYVVWLDPDTLILDMNADLRDGCPDGIGACWHRIPQMNHWNTGALYIQNSVAVCDFMDAWLATFPGERAWMEQGEFNKLAMQNKVVQTISDRWNATLNYSMVPDAVVLGFHGNGDPAGRLRLIQETYQKLQATEPIGA